MQNQQYFCNPISKDSPDPFVMFHDGYYYMMCTERTKIVIHRSRKIADIMQGESITVYRAGKEVQSCIWAPELHRIGNRWYIYSSGCTVGSDYNSIRMFCLESEKDDPFCNYTFKAFTDPDIYAIDQTVFYNEENGKYYNIFVQIRKETGNTIMIGELVSPDKIGAERTVLKHTEFEWEKQKGRVTEGPFILKHDGRVFLIYSANDTFSPYYSLGLMEFSGGDPMDADNWIRYEKPFFSGANGVFAVGHASVFLSPDGSEHWISFHGNESTENYDRSLYLQRFDFTDDGLPDFHEPIARGEKIACPSGE